VNGAMRIELGRIGRAVGLHGEMRLNRLPDFWPASLGSRHLKRLSERGAESVEVTNSREAGKSLILRFADVADRESAQSLAGALLLLDGELDVPGPETVRPFQLRGMRVRLVDGSPLGTVKDLEPNPAQPLLVVAGDEKEYRIPWVEPLVPRVDYEAGWIEVAPPPGLLEL